MAEYITRAALMGALTASDMQHSVRGMTGQDAYNAFLEMVNSIPAADPVHAAGGCYCRECIHYKEFRTKRHNQLMRRCCRMGKHDMDYPTNPDDFCSRGKRKEPTHG